MALKAKLKFKDSLPYETEKALFARFGFRIYARKMHEYLIVEKEKGARVQPRFTIIDGGKEPTIGRKVIVKPNPNLSAETVASLMKRIHVICGMSKNVKNGEFVIRTRLNNICQTLPHDEAAFISEWMDENLLEK